MKLLVVGAGAIGGYVGGHLALSGHTVTLVARPAVASALQAHGLTLRQPGETTGRTVRALGVAASIAEALRGEYYDGVALAVKSFDTEGVITELSAAAAPPPLLCLQNGVDNEAALAAAFGAEHVIAGTVTSPVTRPAPHIVAVERARGVGLADSQPLAGEVLRALRAAGVQARGYPAAAPMKWSKLFTNLVGNATAALLDMPVSAVFGHPGLFALEAAALRECRAVMRAHGYPVVDLPGVPVRLLAWATGLPRPLARLLLQRAVGRGRGGKMPSLHIDLHSGRRQTEVRWLNGAVARHAEDLNLAAPVNRALTEALEAVTAGQLPLDAFRHSPRALLARCGLGGPTMGGPTS